MQWKSMLIPEQTLTLPAPPKRPLLWLLLPCLIAEEPSPRCHLAARRDPIKGAHVKMRWGLVIFLLPVRVLGTYIDNHTFVHSKNPERTTYYVSHVVPNIRSLSNSPILLGVCLWGSFPTLTIPISAVSHAPFHQEFSGCFPPRPFRLNFLWKTPRQVFLSASGLWLAVLFTLVIFLVAAMLARYVTSKGEKEQMENVGSSAPTAKEAPGIFQTKRRRGRFFLRVGLFFYAGKTQPLLLHTKFMEQPKSGANLEIRRVWTCDQPWSQFRSWPAFVQYIEVGGSSIDSAALRSFWRITC